MQPFKQLDGSLHRVQTQIKAFGICGGKTEASPLARNAVSTEIIIPYSSITAP
jgi:hypothetical protein